MELLDTVELMVSDDYKNRMKAEYLQTKIRYDKLHKMIVKYESNTLDFEPSCSLELLKKQGIKRVLCTGRHVRELEQLGFFELGLDFDGYILLNGQIILDKDLNYIDGTPIDKEEMKKIERVFNEKKVSLILETREELFCNFYDDFYLEGLRSVNTDPFPIKEYHGEEIFQVSTYVKKETKEYLRKEFSGCFMTSWNEYGALFVNKQGGKSKGIEKYLKSVNETPKETMAFGDGDNDLDMLEYCGVGVGMGNGTKNVIEHCDYLTETIDNDGLYLALKHLGVVC